MRRSCDIIYRLSPSAPFADRREAGRLLAEELSRHGLSDGVVLGLPRGGVPVAAEVARQLGAPLDVFVVRKLGVPGHEELALGAIATGGVRVLNQDVVAAAQLTREDIERVTARELEALEARERTLRGQRLPLELAGHAVILVDDGLATGATMRAAVDAARRRDPSRLVVAVPVAPPATCSALREQVDAVICLREPEPFVAVGVWYHDFTPVSDEEVRRLLVGDVAE